MPILTQEFIKYKISEIDKQQNQKQVEQEKYLFYNGNVKPLLEKAIRKEFKKPQSIEGLIQRLLPLNIMQRIVDKIASVYVESPIRDVIDGNEKDNQLLSKYEDEMLFNVRMRESDRHFEMFKKTIASPYVDQTGMPRLRILPAHTYYPFSDDDVSPDIPDLIVNVLKQDQDKNNNLYAWWTDEAFFLTDGYGKILRNRMDGLGNPSGINPYGKIPFVYMVDSNISVEPIPEDDLYYCSLALPILLTDLSFASKYMAWSLIWTVNCNVDIPSGPASVLHLNQNPDEPKPEVNQLKPEVDIDQTLRLIESIVSYLLSSKGLKSTSLTGQLTQDNATSGVAKMIDSAELIEQRKDKQSFFYQYERKIWDLISKNMLPYWRSSGLLNPEINEAFSETFKVTLQLKEPKAMLSEPEQVELSKRKIEAGLSTLRRELYTLYPDFNDEDVDDLLRDIQNEKLENLKRVRDEMGMQEEPQSAGENENE